MAAYPSCRQRPAEIHRAVEADGYGVAEADDCIEPTTRNDGARAGRVPVHHEIVHFTANNPSLKIYITLGSGTGGPDNSLINRAANAGLTVRRPPADLRRIRLPTGVVAGRL